MSTGPRHATMSIFTIEEILEVLSAKVVSGQSPQSLKKRIRRVISDSRLVRGGDLFVAFVGDRYDGHAFVPAALAQGAVGAIVREDYALPPQTKRMVRPVLLGVKDTLLAYQQLATHHRNRFTIPLVAITGSNGKTTTKDMVASVLAQRWRTLKTEGNLNNRIGVPQTLFQLTRVTRLLSSKWGWISKAKPCACATCPPDHRDYHQYRTGSSRISRQHGRVGPGKGGIVGQTASGWCRGFECRRSVFRLPRGEGAMPGRIIRHVVEGGGASRAGA